jgi:hypothetical protein
VSVVVVVIVVMVIAACRISLPTEEDYTVYVKKKPLNEKGKTKIR